MQGLDGKIWLLLFGIVMDQASGSLMAQFPRAGLPIRPEQPPTDIPKLIADLGSPEFAVRDRASRVLEERGAAALASLEQAQHHDVLEIALRAETLYRRIHAKELNFQLIQGKSVTLPSGKLRLGDLFENLKKQTGYEFKLDGDQAVLARQVESAGTKGLSVWEAVLPLLEQAGLCVDQAQSAQRLPARRTPASDRFREIEERQAQLKRLQAYRLDHLALTNRLVQLQVQLQKADQQLRSATTDQEKAQADALKLKLVASLKSLSQEIEDLERRFQDAERTPITPAAGTITLKARPQDSPGATLASHGFLLELQPTDSRFLLPDSPHVFAGEFKVIPEPSLRWVQTTGVKILQAKTLDQVLLPQHYGHVTFSSAARGRNDLLSSKLERLDSAYDWQPRFAVTAPADSGDRTILRELRGEVTGKIWSARRQLFVIDIGDGQQGRLTHQDERTGTTLMTQWEPGMNESTLTVTVKYPPDQLDFSVEPDQETVTRLPDVQQIEIHGRPTRNAGANAGVELLDDLGQPCVLPSTMIISSVMSPGSMQAIISYRVPTPRPGQRSLRKIIFSASVLQEVRIPFVFKNVELQQPKPVR